MPLSLISSELHFSVQGLARRHLGVDASVRSLPFKDADLLFEQVEVGGFVHETYLDYGGTHAKVKAAALLSRTRASPNTA